MIGTIRKGIAGFYYTEACGEIYECKARGIFRKEGMVPHVGDRVELEMLGDGRGMINEILPRKNVFIRPPVANVDCFVVVCAATKPKPNLLIIDQFLVMAEENHTDAVVCINKADLADEEDVLLLADCYRNIYPTCCVSAKNGSGIEELKKYLVGRTCALAGPSGVGKSSLLNHFKGSETMQTGEISGKTSRGKHTTRHAELFEMEYGGYIFDTPGFTSFDILDTEEEELAFLFPEMAGYLGKCRYDDCKHLKEPSCAVIAAVKSGKIKKSRYDSYAAMMKSIQEKRRF